MRKDVLRIGFMRVAEARTRIGYVWVGCRERPHRVLQHRQGGSRRTEEDLEVERDGAHGRWRRWGGRHMRCVG